MVEVELFDKDRTLARFLNSSVLLSVVAGNGDGPHAFLYFLADDDACIFLRWTDSAGRGHCAELTQTV